jgi:hypothetical protein
VDLYNKLPAGSRLMNLGKSGALLSYGLQTEMPAVCSDATIEEYWKHVGAILEYRSGTRLGFRERGVVIKLCQDYDRESSRIGMDKKSGKPKREAVKYSWRKPRSLEDLLENIEAWMPFTRGQEEMIYMQLREYLRPAIAEIERTDFTDKLKLAPGINVMDVTDLSDGLKTLVIRSVIEWVHKHGRKIVVIIPEAWKFIPEGRSTPVKLALEALIREGAGVENFVWMDSQDLRGVDKMLLRSVIVWLFGVQRQKNEVASTLASIPDHPKPTATEVMQLGKGQFYVCYGTTLKHTYVQPAGMDDSHAQAIARGEESPDSWRQIERALDQTAKDESETENETPEGSLAERDAEISPQEDRLGGDVLLSTKRESATDVEDQRPRAADRGALGGQVGKWIGGAPGRQLWVDHSDEMMNNETEDETVWKEKYEELKAQFDTLVATHDAIAQEVGRLRDEILKLRSPSGASRPLLRADEDGGEGPAESDAGSEPVMSAAVDGKGLGTAALVPTLLSTAQEQIYCYIIARAEKDLRVPELLVSRPELRIHARRARNHLCRRLSLRGALGILISEKFFDRAIEFSDVRKELIRRGFLASKAPNRQISQALEGIVELGFLTKEDTGYQAVPGMKIHIVEAGARAERAAAR